MSEVNLYLGDCLEYMKSMPDKSVDAIITDLPYGTTACSWDVIIPFEPMWEQVKRINKGVFVTTASQPFTSKLIMSNIKMFKEEIIWDKRIPSGMSYARFMHMRRHENIIVFCNNRMTYNPQCTQRDKPIKKGGNKFSETAPIEACKSGTKFDKTYDTKQPTTIIQIDKVRLGSVHSTQKPVALYDYLIRTYTNEGDTVLDICMGSGTTLVAAIQLGRNVIGCEIDPDYFAIAEKRIKEATLQPQLFNTEQPKITQENFLERT